MTTLFLHKADSAKRLSAEPSNDLSVAVHPLPVPTSRLYQVCFMSSSFPTPDLSSLFSASRLSLSSIICFNFTSQPQAQWCVVEIRWHDSILQSKILKLSQYFFGYLEEVTAIHPLLDYIKILWILLLTQKLISSFVLYSLISPASVTGSFPVAVVEVEAACLQYLT